MMWGAFTAPRVEAMRELPLGESPQHAERVEDPRKKHFGRAASASRRYPHLFFLLVQVLLHCERVVRVVSRSAPCAAETGGGENLTFRMLLSWRRLFYLGDIAPPRGSVLYKPC